MSDRTVVVLTGKPGRVIKVCDSVQAFDEWIEMSVYDRNEIATTFAVPYTGRDAE